MRKVAFLFTFLLLWNCSAVALPRVAAVDAVRMNVKDINAEVKFYTDVLGFQVAKESPGADGRIRLLLGTEAIELQKYDSKCERTLPADSKSNDLWFQHIAIVVRDMNEAYQRLQVYGVNRVSPEPQTLPAWNRAAAGIKAFYFQDPEGHNLELINFPPGKGDPRWQVVTQQLFLGIDHTAIAVSSTAQSLEFYRGQLGFALAGESENWGEEQARLNNVPGAHLKITGLRIPGSFGLEFLEYLSPRNGRVTPEDACEGDLRNVTTVFTNTSNLSGSFSDPDGHQLVFSAN